MSSSLIISQLDLGHYEAERAAALAGVPRSTLYYWARTELIVRSVSAEREKVWSYRDLLTLRLVRWLRTPKENLGIARTAMAEVRDLLEKSATTSGNLRIYEASSNPCQIAAIRRGVLAPWRARYMTDRCSSCPIVPGALLSHFRKASGSGKPRC